MDADRFDAITRSIALQSRRGLLRFAVGSGLASFSAILDTAARKKRKKKKKCKGGTKKCGGRCIPKGTCCTGADCPDGTFCQHGGCFAGCSGATPENCLVGGACGSCLCLTTTAGPNVCVAGFICAEAQPCADDTGCPLGEVCAPSGCCTAFGKPRVCAPPCPL